MDAEPSFGVSMISDVPSNPQLTLLKTLGCTVRPKIGPVYHSEINCMIYNQKLFD